MMNIKAAMTIKKSWETFTMNHPKFPMFLDAAKRKGIKDGTVIEISIKDPDGQVIETNVKITESDLQLFETLKSIQE